MAEAPSVRTSIRLIALKGISDKSANTPPRPPSAGRAPSIKTIVDDGPRPRRLMLDAKGPTVPETLRVVAPRLVSFVPPPHECGRACINFWTHPVPLVPNQQRTGGTHG